jgi:twinkle protein
MVKGSDFLQHEPCPKCGSSDAMSRYSDGHGYCFSCKHYEKGEGMENAMAVFPREVKGDMLPAGEAIALTSRNISQETCAKWGYTSGSYRGQPAQIANYRDAGGTLIAQKVRLPNKQFFALGDFKNAGLYGQHLWRDGGKRIVITEGEIDALSVSQVFNNRWPVVSVPNGAQGAAKALAKQLGWLEQFDEIVLMFDNDQPGIEAAGECALLFTPGKCKVARLPLKDASDMLKAGRGAEIAPAVFEAKVFRPDGIINGKEIEQSVLSDDDGTLEYPFPWAKLQAMTEGYRAGEVIMWCSGSGMGKSQIVRQGVEYELLTANTDVNIGLIRLEESVKRAGRGLMGLYLKRPVHKRSQWEAVTPEQRKEAYDATLGTGRVFLYDHFGSTNIDNLMARIRFLAKGCDCKVIVLDHISIVVSGEEDGDERRLIDNLMTALATVAQETGVVLHVISHLKRPNGDKGHEDGARVSLAQLRGSHAIAQLSHTVIGLERNQQDEATKHITTIRLLKCRWTGETGVAGWLAYDQDTGWLSELQDDPFAGGADAPPPPEDDAF